MIIILLIRSGKKEIKTKTKSELCKYKEKVMAYCGLLLS